MNQTIEQQIECSTCTWDKNCISPPSMTEAEVKEKFDENKKPKEGEKDDSLMGSLMSVMFFAGKDRECHACPTFINKLRESRELSDKIREFMKSV